MDKDLQSIQQARDLIGAARRALETLRSFDQQQADRIVDAMAAAVRLHAGRLAEMAVEETGYGNARDKRLKNLFSSVDVYNYIRDLKTCGVIAENLEKGVVDIGVPAGVIAAIIPTTNPTSTAIFKVLAALKGRNAIILSPHPNARECTIETARIMQEAAIEAGAPEGAIGWMETVTIDGTNELMRNRGTNLILATGGAGLVRAAYSSGKPAYGVGPGNVPAFIERTADVAKAVRDIVTGKSFDYGVLCSSEQALICDAPIEAQVLDELRRNRAYLAEGDELAKLERLVAGPDGRLNTAIVGQSPQKIATLAGFSVPPDASCLVGRARGVGRDHPLSMEKLSPVLAFYTADGWEAGCERCIEILQFGGLGHTMSIHSTDEKIILEFGLHKPAYRVCVNTPATLGAVGLTTGVPPSMTLGCGTPGGNITSDNITPLHLINIKRLAWEQRAFEEISYDDADSKAAVVPSPPTDSLRSVVRSVVEDYLDQKTTAARTEQLPAAAPPSIQETAPEPPPPPQAPPLTVEKPKRVRPSEPAVDFVSEEDVRMALRENRRIVINSKTIVTPAARDLGEAKDVFVGEG